MLDAFVATLVATLAKRAADGVADAAEGAWSALVQLVRRKLGSDPRSEGELEAAQQVPDDRERQVALEEALRRAVAEDPQFGEQLRLLWREAQVEIHADHGGVASQISGTAQRLVQAGRDVTVNYVSAPVQLEIPRQVPAAAPTFVNRAAELSILDRTFGAREATGTPMGVLVGMPGVGKTALARRWVAMARGRFPGGELHVDFTSLRGRGGVGAATSEAVASCLRSLGVDDRLLPAGLAELTNLYRTRTSDNPVLVVLDGVNEAGQVRALVPNAPGSAVVVTTEYALGELVLGGGRMIPVKPLDDEAAVLLLAAVCESSRIMAEPDAARAVARLCGGLPVALQVAAARLVLDPTLSVAALAGELADEAHRLEALSLPGWATTGVQSTVAAAFAVSYVNLPEPAQQLYRDLGVLPVHDFSQDLMLAVADAEPASTRAALDALATASLVEPTGSGRYRLHQLVRLHAARQAATDPEHRGRQLVGAVVAFYLTRAAWADRAVMGERLRVGGFDPAASGVDDPFAGPDRRTAGLAWLEAERANLLAVLRAAVDAGLDEAAWQLAETLCALYFNHRHHVDWIEATRLGVQTASRRGRPDVEARLRSVVSRAFTDLGDLKRARIELDAALSAATAADDPALLASVWEYRGRYLEHVDTHQAIEAYQKSISLNREAGQARGVALARYFLGGCLDQAGRASEALAVLETARDALRELGDERMAARCTFSIGLVYLHLASYAEAKRELTAAVDAFAARQLWHYEIPAREALADLAVRAGDNASARDELAQALRIEETAGGAAVTRLRAALAALSHT